MFTDGHATTAARLRLCYVKVNATDLPPTAPAPAEAVTALYRGHALGLIRLAVAMLGDRAAAGDVVQEAFCGLYRSRTPSAQTAGVASLSGTW